jgi:hypothetical protein
MALLHHSSGTSTDQPVTDQPVTDQPVTDVMASNAVVTPTQEVPTRVTEYSGTRVVEQDVAVPRASATIAFGAFIALLLSAWAGIVPFIGPTFGFSADGTSSWTWNEVHAYGALVPGAVGVLACLLIFASIRRPVATGTWGFVLFLCGAWLTVVPVVWPVIVGPYFHAASPSMALAHWLAYSSGPGILLAAFGAYIMGRSRSRAALSNTAVA